jgi:hypothetical protein
MITARVMENETPSEFMHVALVGPENNGKSHLFTTAPGVKLVLDFDDKSTAIAGKKDTYAITFKDSLDSFKMPTAVEEIIDVLSGLEQSLDLHNLRNNRNEPIFPNVKEGTIVKSIAYDSMASLGRLVMNYELYNSGDLARTLKLGPKLEVKVTKGFDGWNAEMGGVLQLVLRGFALPVNVFCIFHERAEESPDSTLEKPKFTGRVGVYPVRYKDLLIKYFTEIWRVRLTMDSSANFVPKVYTKPDFAFDSGTAMLLDKIEEPNIAAMFAKHKQRLSSGVAGGTVAQATGKYK